MMVQSRNKWGVIWSHFSIHLQAQVFKRIRVSNIGDCSEFVIIRLNRFNDCGALRIYELKVRIY